MINMSVVLGNFSNTPTRKQLELLKKLRCKTMPKSSREASELILKNSPVTQNQLDLLKKRGYVGPSPKSKFEASELLHDYLKPTSKQIKKLKELRYVGPSPKSMKHASELISESASPSIAQIAYLHNLGYGGQIPKNRKNTSVLIDKQKIKQKSDSCPKCTGSGTFDDGEIRIDCPYCDGSGLLDNFDEGIGDRIIYEKKQEQWNSNS